MRASNHIGFRGITVCCRVIEFMRGGYAQSTDISKMLGKPHRYSEQKLQIMVRTGILEGKRGPSGGYELTDKGRTMDVLDLANEILGEQTSPLALAWRGMKPATVVKEYQCRK